MTLYLVLINTEQEYTKVMKALEKGGYTFPTNIKPTSVDIWKIYRERLCVEVNTETKLLRYANRFFFQHEETENKN